jgi:CHAD domain-containing protein
MRITFKKLRYTLEFFSPLLTPKEKRLNMASLTKLQDELGLIIDHITAEALIAEVLTLRPPQPIHGWISGRHQLLVSELQELLQTWL